VQNARTIADDIARELARCARRSGNDRLVGLKPKEDFENHKQPGCAPGTAFRAQHHFEGRFKLGDSDAVDRFTQRLMEPIGRIAPCPL
jgi:hypothetical protein